MLVELAGNGTPFLSIDTGTAGMRGKYSMLGIQWHGRGCVFVQPESWECSGGQ